MTNEYVEWTNIIFCLLVIAGVAVMIAAQLPATKFDPDLETLGRVSNTLLGGAIVMYAVLVRHSLKISELVGRIEALEEDPKE